MENLTRNHAEALLVSEVGLRHAPRNCKLHFKAVAYEGLGQIEKSIEWFKKTITLHPPTNRPTSRWG